MAVVKIRKTSPTPEVIWIADNINSMSIKSSSPLMVITMPEQDAQDAYITKMQGNLKEGTIVSRINRLTRSPFRTAANADVAGTNGTVMNQIKYFHESFFPENIQSQYYLTVDDDNGTNIFDWECNISDITTSEADDAPDLWTVVITVSFGDNIIVVDDN